AGKVYLPVCRRGGPALPLPRSSTGNDEGHMGALPGSGLHTQPGAGQLFQPASTGHPCTAGLSRDRRECACLLSVRLPVPVAQRALRRAPSAWAASTRSHGRGRVTETYTCHVSLVTSTLPEAAYAQLLEMFPAVTTLHH